MTKPNLLTESAPTSADTLTVSAMPVTITSAVADQQAPPRRIRAIDLDARQRRELLGRLAKATAARQPFNWPGDNKPDEFLQLFDADFEIDPQASAAFNYQRDQCRRDIAAAICFDLKKM